MIRKRKKPKPRPVRMARKTPALKVMRSSMRR